MKTLLALISTFIATTAFALTPIIPPKLKAGDTVGLVSSGFRVDNNATYQRAKRRLKALGLHVITGKAVLGHDGYFAGSDAARARDINTMFANPKINAIFEIRGGWGSARILNKLNYKLIRQHPKIFIGFSDITSLLLAIHDKTGLVTFHGPMPGSFTWPRYTTQHLRAMLFNTKPVTLKNPRNTAITTITPGTATGQLIGGNLTVLTRLIGTPYMPKSWKGKILFVEDTHEDVYQIDRMLTQLQLAGILPQLSGFIFGRCTDCSRLIPGSPSLIDVIKQHIQPLGIPAWFGAMIGHQSYIWTVPEGLRVRINATNGSIKILHSAVS